MNTTQSIDSFSFFFYFLIIHYSLLKIQFFYMFLLGVILSNSTCYKLFQVKREKDFFYWRKPYNFWSPQNERHHKWGMLKGDGRATPPLLKPPVTLLGAHSELLIPERSFLLRLSTPNYRISLQIRRENKVQSFFARDAPCSDTRKVLPGFPGFRH